jgi:PAS domain-containing protein
MQESLWNMNAESAHSLVESVMRDRSVLQVQVVGQADTQFMHVRSPRVASGNVYRAEREILVRGERIGRIMVEMDDARSQQELREKQLSYVFVLAAQLMVSLLLIVLFLNSRLIKPLRKLMRFSDRLSHGDFETRLDVTGSDELGRLAQQLEQMRVAIKRLFEDIGQREERFRTIVTQVPGAVFRFRPDGPIDFVSDAIEDISGYSAAQFMRSTTHSWTNLIAPEDRKKQRRVIGQAIRTASRTKSNTASSTPPAPSAGCRKTASRSHPEGDEKRRGWTASSPTSASASTTKCASKRCWPSRARSWTT